MSSSSLQDQSQSSTSTHNQSLETERVNVESFPLNFRHNTLKR
ncbi:unnamed protein product [Arabidopsis halleri]